MSTPNFSYEHRCIVVTDDDFEMGNVPETDSIPQGYCSYPQVLIPTEFKFHHIVLTSGYYCGACIDYEEKDDDWESLLGYGYGCCPTTRRDFFGDMTYMHGLSEYRLRKLCKDIKRKDFDFPYQYSDALCEAVGLYLMEKEREEVNTYLDELMAYYGYEEYVCMGVYSNGEAIYAKKAHCGREALLQAVAS